MGSSVSLFNINQSSYGLWTAEEKYEIELGESNQRRGAEFAVEYMFYGGSPIHLFNYSELYSYFDPTLNLVPVTTRRANTDPLAPLWIHIDEEAAQEVEVSLDPLHGADEGDIKVIFKKTNLKYEFRIADIDACMDKTLVQLPLPSPPGLSLATAGSLHVLNSLPFPAGISQRLELQYSPLVSPTAPTHNWLSLGSKSWESPEFMHHILDGLRPGSCFSFRLRYWTPRGWSDWSLPSAPFLTLPAPPDSPAAPFAAVTLPDAVQLCWFRPHHNGAPVTMFVLEGRGVGYQLGSSKSKTSKSPLGSKAARQSSVSAATARSRDEADTEVVALEGSPSSAEDTESQSPCCDDDSDGTSSQEEGEGWVELHRGAQMYHLVRHLQPDCPYSFRVAAVNSAGQSRFSLPMSLHTPSRSTKGTGSIGESASVAALQCAAAWRECWDELTGQPFFFNIITGTRHAFLPDSLTGVSTRASPASKGVGAVAPVVSADEDPAAAKEKAFRLKRYKLIRSLLFSDSAAQSTPAGSPVARAGARGGTDRGGSAQLQLSVRRDELLLDVLNQVSEFTVSQLRGDPYSRQRRQRTRVQFLGEEGIDAGGPSREFFVLASSGIVSLGLRQGWLRSTDNGAVFFKVQPQGVGGPAGLALEGIASKSPIRRIEQVPASRWCWLLGRLAGLAILDRQLISAPVSRAWLQQMLTGEGTGTLDQLADIDSALHRSLCYMLQPDVDIADIVSETFSVPDPHQKRASISVSEGKEADPTALRRRSAERRISLCPGGTGMEVTQSNKTEYIELLVKWHTCYSVGPLILAFLEGFHQLVPMSLLASSELSPEELGQLLGGRAVVDVDLLRAHAVYQSSQKPSSVTPVVGVAFGPAHFMCVWFWECLRECPEEQQRAVLRFITGSERIPLDGFDPPLNITLGEDMKKDSLPRAHTCFNQLVLPMYSSYEALREKVLFAVENTAGFSLS